MIIEVGNGHAQAIPRWGLWTAAPLQGAARAVNVSTVQLQRSELRSVPSPNVLIRCPAAMPGLDIEGKPSADHERCDGQHESCAPSVTSVVRIASD